MNLKLPDNIIEAYAFANTPAYLYRKLIANEFVLKIGAQKAETLIEFINSSNSESVESVALAYAALIALLHKNTDLSAVLKLPATQQLEWVPALVSLFRQKVTTMSVIKIKQPTISVPLEKGKLTPFTITRVQNHD